MKYLEAEVTNKSALTEVEKEIERSINYLNIRKMVEDEKYKIFREKFKALEKSVLIHLNKLKEEDFFKDKAKLAEFKLEMKQLSEQAKELDGEISNDIQAMIMTNRSN